MTRYSVLAIPIFLLFAGGRALAQTTHEQEKTNEVNQEPVKEHAASENKPSPPVVKVVPPSRARNAKPAKVTPAKARSARPGGARPARNPKPSARPPRPHNGRH